jgi:hypothetical protein
MVALAVAWAALKNAIDDMDDKTRFDRVKS